MTDTASDLRRSCENLGRENVRLKERLAAQKQRAASLAQTVSHLRKEMEEARKKFEDELAKRDATIKGLTNELEKTRAIQAHDGTNTGMSTSRTPIGKDKVISNNNSRQKSGDPKGGSCITKSIPLTALTMWTLRILRDIPWRKVSTAPDAAVPTSARPESQKSNTNTTSG